eukprot:3784573-Prymnesium_polylepis.1
MGSNAPLTVGIRSLRPATAPAPEKGPLTGVALDNVGGSACAVRTITSARAAPEIERQQQSLPTPCRRNAVGGIFRPALALRESLRQVGEPRLAQLAPLERDRNLAVD